VIPWSATSVLDIAWERYKPQAVIVSFAVFVVMWIAAMPGALRQILVFAHVIPEEGWKFQVVSIPLTVLGSVIDAYLQGGLTKMTLKLARGETVEFGDAFTGRPYFVRMLIVTFSTIVLTVVGLGLLVVPGIIVLLALWLAPYFLVDQDLGAIDAMRASWKAWSGHKRPLFLLGLLATFIGIAGVCTLCVGLFVALPVIKTAAAIAYIHIADRQEPA
jgi:hypothetical protein